MALINIEYGSLASSEVVNNNFQYLDDKISKVTQNMNTDVTSLSESMSTLSSTVEANLEAANTADETLQSNIDEVVADLEEARSAFGVSYIVEKYVSGTSWYRIWSDGFKEQGGRTWTLGSHTIYFLKSFSNTNYTYTMTSWLNPGDRFSNGINHNVGKNVSYIGIHIPNSGNYSGADWYACGY